MTEPKPEIAAAADWWARRLAGERSWLQPGDPTPTVGLTRFEPRKRTPEEVEAFRACGGTYVDHESEEAWARSDRCTRWYREET